MTKFLLGMTWVVGVVVQMTQGVVAARLDGPTNLRWMSVLNVDLKMVGWSMRTNCCAYKCLLC